MTADAPIGVFDSGLGGLSVLRELHTALPHEDFLYVADTAYCPYGSKPREVVVARAERITTTLQARGVKLVTVACNTATVAAIDTLRQRHTVPFVGIEPAVKPAAQLTRSGVVGVLSTAVTAHGARVQSLIQRYAHGVQVLTQACPGLVEHVEAGDLDSPAVRHLVRQYTAPLLAAGADVLVLGCTHYPFLRALVAEEAGDGVQVIDTGAAVARRVADVLGEARLLSGRAQAGTVQFFTTGDAAHMEAVASRLLAASIRSENIDLS
ncbi:MAG: glutamate racemase [Nevskiaceae bacterium]|nr:MAG: glutamate racemase [Nevskiaceae bacterium]TBR74738.1 MAG: glutamate racemase [Nevskiaceae bacterium]